MTNTSYPTIWARTPKRLRTANPRRSAENNAGISPGRDTGRDITPRQTAWGSWRIQLKTVWRTSEAAVAPRRATSTPSMSSTRALVSDYASPFDT